MTGAIDPAEEEAVAVWLRLRAVFGGGRRPKRERVEEIGESVPFGAGRAPRPVGRVLDDVTRTHGWTTPLARTDLVGAWTDIAGEETARHAEVVGIEDGVLTVRCDSTAWATQLALMRRAIASRIAAEYPEAGVESIRFQGPNTTSWNRGRRSVPGRGPRDTYG